MPAFHFKLQPLVRLREAARDACREQLAEVLRIDDRLRLQQEELELSRRKARELQTIGTGRVDVDRLIAAQRFEGAVVGELHYVEQQRERVAVEIERRRLALVEADRGVKSLEKLKESRRLEHAKASAAAEMKLLDEAASRRPAEEVDV